MIKKFQRTKNKKSKNILTDEDIERLIVLGKDIQADLSCDLNCTGFPCRTDRLSAVEFMKEYLSIHDIEIKDNR
jgi:hypothetical protein|tara:strand:- start:221 stop:442 length:222 start_codon:yes stop_codon:yes gene_type:complete